MNIGIVGCGIVGTAIKVGFETLGHFVSVHDLKLQSDISSVLKTDVCYICVGTPSHPDGSCNIDHVASVIDELNDSCYQGIAAIKSTVEPGTISSLIQKYPKLEICHVPEFLRERCATQDFIENHNLLVVGTSNDHVYNKIVKSHGHFPVNRVQLTVDEAELVKYFSNTYKAWKVTYANSFATLCKKMNVDYTHIKDTFLLHGVKEHEYLADYGAFGGGCLPKDTHAIAALVRKLNLDIQIFDHMLEENEKYS